MFAKSATAIVAGMLLIVGCGHGESTSPKAAATEMSSNNIVAGSADHTHRAAPGNGKSASALAAHGFGAERYRLVSEKDEIVAVLKNGMVVITRRIQSPVLAVRGVALTGGIYEGKWLGGGLSHLLEHLVAGGSNQRRTEEQNKDLLQKIGNNSNAYTTEDNTSFFINTTADHLNEGVDLVTGWMLGAKITQAEFEREREVVQRELEMGRGEPDRQLFYLAAMERYRQSPAGVPVIGYQPVIKRLQRDDVYTYYKMAYQPNNMVFAVAGDLDPEKMLQAVRRNVDMAPPGRAFSHDIAGEPPVLTPRSIVATFPKLGQARVMLGFPGVSLNSPDLYAIDVLSAALGTGDSSLLVEELRDKQHLVSAITASDETPPYVSGTIEVMMELDPGKVSQATDAVLELLDGIKKNGLDADRLARAKTQLRAQRVRAMQKAEDIAASLADDYRSTGDAHFSDKYVGRVEKVTARQVQAVAKKYLVRGRLLTTALLPSEWAGAKGMANAQDILRPLSPASHPAATQAIASSVRRVVLDNGTVLLLKRDASSPLVAINMYALGGVTAEDAKTNGLGNLTMQMLMRGSTAHSARQIAEFFDSTGGAMDATCGHNSWFWNASCFKENFDKTLEMYADVVNNPAFPDGELKTVKDAVVSGIHDEESNWEQQTIRFFRREYFGPRHSSYQFTSIGTADTVEKFSVGQMKDWYEKKVLPAPRVLAIYGDVDLDKAQVLAADLLGKGEKRAAPAERSGDAQVPDSAAHPAHANRASGGAGATASANVLSVKVQKTEQALAGVVIAYNSDSVVGEPDTYRFAVAQTLTGGYTYPTGYLFETLRGLGLVYVVQSANMPGLSVKMPGTFFVFAGCDPKNVNEVVEQSLLNVARLQGTPADIHE